jgi:hypothetical protein
MMLALATAAAVLAIHAGVAARTGLGFADAFKLSRGLASLGLAALGFFALLRWSPAWWATAWVTSSPDPLAVTLVQIPVGHFLGDFALMAWGRAREGSAARLRPDLVAHHGLGLFAAGTVIAWPIAAPLYLVLFTTELMPVTTALAGLATLRKSRGLTRAAVRGRVLVLLGWRLPLWLWLAVRFFGLWADGAFVGDRRAVYGFSSVFLVIMLGLDALWLRGAVRALRRG